MESFSGACFFSIPYLIIYITWSPAPYPLFNEKNTMFKYFPHTPDDIQRMLDVIGVKSLDDLYADVPAGVRLKTDSIISPCEKFGTISPSLIV